MKDIDDNDDDDYDVNYEFDETKQLMLETSSPLITTQGKRIKILPLWQLLQ